MHLKYIGKNGSMGLVTGKVYKVKVTSQKHFIWVEWGFCKACPYESPLALSKNWEKVTEG